MRSRIIETEETYDVETFDRDYEHGGRTWKLYGSYAFAVYGRTLARAHAERDVRRLKNLAQ